jgi:pimeloyl-ACP methyl ester carboxylesterase
MSKFHSFPGPYGSVLVRESDGHGAPIVFIHGNSSSSRAFERQIEGALGKRRRLVAFDLMGFGDSQKVADPSAYLLNSQACTLVAVAEGLGLTNAVFVGWSLGGHILLEAAPDLPRAAGLAIFGTPPIGFPPAMDKAFLPNPKMALGFTPELSREQAHDYVDAFFAPGFLDIADFFVEDVLKAAPLARAQIYASLDPSRMRDEIVLCAGLSQPLAILHGERDRLINGAYFADLALPTLWRGAVQAIGDAGHAPQWEKPGTFDALIDAFAADCGD